MTFAIYIHWPFCKSKCPYCDFNSHVVDTIDHMRYLSAYLLELEYWAEKTPKRIVTSIFFGGGTPSLMLPDIVAEIIAFIQKKWRISNDCEITLEANPTSIETHKFMAFRDAGVNRVSIGVQSLNANDLKFLGREHTPDQAIAAIQIAANTFDRFSFDLIYARPKQTIESWKSELNQALSIAGGHLSLYQLTIEQGTPFFTRHARGEFIVPEQDHAADLYDTTFEIMDKNGFINYEISNYAKMGEESRHNLAYWNYADYIGIGAGAHGRITINNEKFATRTHRAPEIWLNMVEKNGNALHPQEKLSDESQIQEKIMMGLRLRSGINIHNIPKNLLEGKPFNSLISQDFLCIDGDFVRATQDGFKCLNAVLGYLLSDNV